MLRIDAVSIFYSSSGDLLQAHAQRRSHDATRTRKTVLSHVSRNNPHPTIFFPFQTGDRVRAKIYLKTLFNFSDRPPSGIGDYFHHPSVYCYTYFSRLALFIFYSHYSFRHTWSGYLLTKPLAALSHPSLARHKLSGPLPQKAANQE